MTRVLRCVARGLQLLLTGVLTLLLACNLYAVVARQLTGNPQPTVFGFSTAVVVSGSMEPALRVNDMIVTKTQDSYTSDDVITFFSEGSLVTHRIVGQEETGFVTRGDANNAPDSQTVAQQDIVGKVVLRIPGVGVLISFLKTPAGMLGLAAVGIALIALTGLMQKRWNNRAAEEEQDNHEIAEQGAHR